VSEKATQAVDAVKEATK
ncbi:Late embryogenesis abundant protein, partial [Haemophilus influenzae]